MSYQEKTDVKEEIAIQQKQTKNFSAPSSDTTNHCLSGTSSDANTSTNVGKRASECIINGGTVNITNSFGALSKN